MDAHPQPIEPVKTFVIGTRGSALALAQTRLVSAALRAAWPRLEVSERVISTTGDERLDVHDFRGLDKGLFTKQLEEALLEGAIDAAVHSLKDLPVDLPGGLVLGAVTRRADARDALVSKHAGGLEGLPEGACVATSSPRRAKLLHLLRPDLTVSPIRGNVPTRIDKLAATPSLDALVLAKAGLDRLGDIVPPALRVTVEPRLLPAPGQGALGIECRAGDSATLGLLEALHDEETARCTGAERALLKSLGGGCEIPLGALAELVDGEIVLRSIFFGVPQA
jgi:hydroxymethylbilane synthase